MSDITHLVGDAFYVSCVLGVIWNLDEDRADVLIIDPSLIECRAG